MTTDTTELDTDTAALVRRLVDLKAQHDEIGGALEAVKAELRGRLDAGTYTLGGADVLAVQQTRKFDADKAITYVPADLRDSCYSRVVDAKKVRQYLPPAVAETCMVDSGQPRIVVL